MSKPPEQAPAPETDVARVERGLLLQTTRNSALQALDTTWSLAGLTPATGGRLGAVRRLVMERLVWPLLHPLIARQQEQNAAVVRAAYAAAEYQDYLGASVGHAHQRLDDLRKGMQELNERTVRERHLLSQQVRDFAEQLAGLEEAEAQLRALLRGEPAPPPATVQGTEDRP